jgi:hypothetical protein
MLEIDLALKVLSAIYQLPERVENDRNQKANYSAVTNEALHLSTCSQSGLAQPFSTF